MFKRFFTDLTQIKGDTIRRLINLACLLIVVMYLLAPLGAIDIYIAHKITNVKDDSDIKEKKLNVQDNNNKQNKDNNEYEELRNNWCDDLSSADDDFSSTVADDLKGKDMPQNGFAKNCDFKGLTAALTPVDHVNNVQLGSNQHALDEDSNSLSLGKDPDLKIDIDDVQVGENVTAKITANKSFTGKVSVYVKGNSIPHKVLVKDGFGETTFKGLSAGNYSGTVVLSDNERATHGVASTNFHVSKIDPDLRINVNNVSDYPDAIADISGNKSFTGNVSLHVKGSIIPQKVLVKNGHACVSLRDLKPGMHVVTVKFAGNKKFASAFDSAKFNIDKDSSDLFLKFRTLKKIKRIFAQNGNA